VECKVIPDSSVYVHKPLWMGDDKIVKGLQMGFDVRYRASKSKEVFVSKSTALPVA